MPEPLHTLQLSFVRPRRPTYLAAYLMSAALWALIVLGVWWLL